MTNVTIAEFLLARIAEDEARAELVDTSPYNLGDTAEEDWAGVHWTAARVLAECEAKRRIAGRHQSDGDEYACCTTCREVGPDAQLWPCDTLLDLASVYADHRDFDPAWRL